MPRAPLARTTARARGKPRHHMDERYRHRPTRHNAEPSSELRLSNDRPMRPSGHPPIQARNNCIASSTFIQALLTCSSRIGTRGQRCRGPEKGLRVWRRRGAHQEEQETGQNALGWKASVSTPPALSRAQRTAHLTYAKRDGEQLVDVVNLLVHVMASQWLHLCATLLHHANILAPLFLALRIGLRTGKARRHAHGTHALDQGGRQQGPTEKASKPHGPEQSARVAPTNTHTDQALHSTR